MNRTENITCQLVIAIALGLAVQAQALAQSARQDSVTQTHYTSSRTGPPVVVDSYMKPTFVRKKTITDRQDNEVTVEEPMIEERFERVMIPKSETNVTSIEQSRANRSTQISNHAHAHVRVASRPASRNKIASRLHTTQKSDSATSTITKQTQATTVESATTFERRHPALDLF